MSIRITDRRESIYPSMSEYEETWVALKMAAMDLSGRDDPVERFADALIAYLQEQRRS